MAEALAITEATAQRYLDGAADNTLRRRLLLRLLQNKGRIKMNASGTSVTWLVKFTEPPVQPHGASGEFSFDEHDLYRQLNVDYRGYISTDKMDEKNRLMNKAPVDLINYYSVKIPNLMQSLEHRFHQELYIDGYAAGNELRLHGLESFLGETTPAAGDIIAEPNDTYGGKNTNLADEGGAWSTDLSTYPNATLATDWPDGKGDASYDYLSPTIVNATSTAWASGTTAWEDLCEIILRRTKTWLTKNAGPDGGPDCYLMGNTKFNGFQQFHSSRFRNIIPHQGAQDLGFGDALSQDGVMVKYEFDVPATTTYVVNADQMELCSLDSKLFRSKGPFFDIKSDANLFSVGFFGNMRFNPKFFGKIGDLA